MSLLLQIHRAVPGVPGRQMPSQDQLPDEPQLKAAAWDHGQSNCKTAVFLAIEISSLNSSSSQATPHVRGHPVLLGTLDWASPTGQHSITRFGASRMSCSAVTPWRVPFSPSHPLHHTLGGLYPHGCWQGPDNCAQPSSPLPDLSAQAHRKFHNSTRDSHTMAQRIILKYIFAKGKLSGNPFHEDSRAESSTEWNLIRSSCREARGKRCGAAPPSHSPIRKQKSGNRFTCIITTWLLLGTPSCRGPSNCILNHTRCWGGSAGPSDHSTVGHEAPAAPLPGEQQHGRGRETNTPINWLQGRRGAGATSERSRWGSSSTRSSAPCRWGFLEMPVAAPALKFALLRGFSGFGSQTVKYWPREWNLCSGNQDPTRNSKLGTPEIKPPWWWVVLEIQDVFCQWSVRGFKMAFSNCQYIGSIYIFTSSTKKIKIPKYRYNTTLCFNRFIICQEFCNLFQITSYKQDFFCLCIWTAGD